MLRLVVCYVNDVVTIKYVKIIHVSVCCNETNVLIWFQRTFVVVKVYIWHRICSETNSYVVVDIMHLQPKFRQTNIERTLEITKGGSA